ncbi:MAG: hypothetical protein SGI89_05885 [bacterium]|nr:hypothetical protein [bacterium]
MNSSMSSEIIKLREEVELLNSRLDKILNPDYRFSKESSLRNKPLSFIEWMKEEGKKQEIIGVKDVDLK